MNCDGPMWDPGIWEDIREAMRQVTERATVGRKFLPRVMASPEATTVNVDRFDQKKGTVSPNLTIPIIEIYADFRLTAEQVEREDTFHEGRAAAVGLTQLLAQVEDVLLFSGDIGWNEWSKRWADEASQTGDPPSLIKVREATFGKNLLSEVEETMDVDIKKSSTKNATRYGENIVAGVQDAIQKLREYNHHGPYALVLPPRAYADASSPLPNSLVVPKELLLRDVEWILSSWLLESSRIEKLIGEYTGLRAVNAVDILASIFVFRTIHDKKLDKFNTIEGLEGFATDRYVEFKDEQRKDVMDLIKSAMSEMKIGDIGLVISIGGNSMDLVVPSEDYGLFFVQVDNEGRYVFRVNHRFALRFKLRHSYAVAMLNFKS